MNVTTEAVEAMRGDPEAWGEPVTSPVRKRKSERRQRGAMVSVRFTPDELAVVQRHAATARMPVSGYLRNLALAAPQVRASRSAHEQPPIPFRPPEDDREWLLAHAEKTGKPVNAILRIALSDYRAKTDPDDILKKASEQQ